MHLIIRFLVNALALYLIAKYVPGFNHGASLGTALIAAVVFGLVNALLGPILRLISFPITFITLGLFSIVINYALFAVTMFFVPAMRTNEINGWLANFYGAVIMMIVGAIAHTASKPDAQRSDSDRR